MPRTRHRRIALVGMAVVVLLAAWLFAVGWMAATGVLENLELEDAARGQLASSFAVVAGTAALTSILGLGLRRRLVTALGAATVVTCAVAFPWLISGWGVAGGDVASATLVALGVASVGLIALWASFARSPR
jgi:hypothetical protein